MEEDLTSPMKALMSPMLKGGPDEASSTWRKAQLVLSLMEASTRLHPLGERLNCPSVTCSVVANHELVM